MHASTQPMRAEAADMGFYESPWGKHAKVQLLTVSELLEGKRVDMPPATGEAWLPSSSHGCECDVQEGAEEAGRRG